MNQVAAMRQVVAALPEQITLHYPAVVGGIGMYCTIATIDCCNRL
jgi:hypothetical protein